MTTIEANSVTESISQAWQEIIDNGEDKYPKTPENGTFRGGFPYRETRHILVRLSDPTQLMYRNSYYHRYIPEYCPRLPMANIRFLMMMAGNNDAEPFIFYEERLRKLYELYGMLPSMDYGFRLRHWRYERGELDQVVSAVRLLKGDLTTRKCHIQFFRPEDVEENPDNTACIGHIALLVGKNGLEPRIFMRSNNAYHLMPNNLYEFGLLLQVIAVEVGIPLHRIDYEVASCHIYKKDLNEAKRTLQAFDPDAVDEVPSISIPIPAQTLKNRRGFMPLKQVEILCQIESAVRADAGLLSTDNPTAPDIFEYYIQWCQMMLLPFWQQFYYPILLFIVNRNKFQYGVRRLSYLMETQWRNCMPNECFAMPHLDFDGNTSQQPPLFVETDHLHPLDNDQIVKDQEQTFNYSMMKLHKHVAVINQEYLDSNQPEVTQDEWRMLRLQLAEPMARATNLANRLDDISLDSVRKLLNVTRSDS